MVRLFGRLFGEDVVIEHALLLNAGGDVVEVGLGWGEAASAVAEVVGDVMFGV